MHLLKPSNLVALAVFVVVVLGCASVQGVDRFAVPSRDKQELAWSGPCAEGAVALGRVRDADGEITHVTIYRLLLGKIHLVAVAVSAGGELTHVVEIQINTGRRTVRTWEAWALLSLPLCDVGMPPGESA